MFGPGAKLINFEGYSLLLVCSFLNKGVNSLTLVKASSLTVNYSEGRREEGGVGQGGRLALIY